MAGYGAVPFDVNATAIVADPKTWIGNGKAQLSPSEIGLIVGASAILVVIILSLFAWRVHCMRQRKLQGAAAAKRDKNAGANGGVNGGGNGSTVEHIELQPFGGAKPSFCVGPAKASSEHASKPQPCHAGSEYQGHTMQTLMKTLREGRMPKPYGGEFGKHPPTDLSSQIPQAKGAE